MTDESWQSDAVDNWNAISTICYALIAIALFIALKRQKRWKQLKSHASTWALLMFFVLCIVTDILTIVCVNPPSYLVKDISIYMQFDIFTSLILISSIVNKSALKLRYIVLLYAPLLLVTFILISFIAEMIQLSSVVVLLPFIYILFIISQTIILLCIRRKIDRRQTIISVVNIVYVVICLIMAWLGWSVVSIILFLTWISLCSIVLIVFLLKRAIGRKVSKHNSPLLE